MVELAYRRFHHSSIHLARSRAVIFNYDEYK